MGGWVDGWMGGWVVEDYTDNKAISAQLSWSWGWGWAWPLMGFDVMTVNQNQ